MKYVSINDLIKYMAKGRGWMHLDIYDAVSLRGFIEGAIEDGASVIDIPDRDGEGITVKYTFDQMDNGIKKFIESIQGNELDLGFKSNSALNVDVDSIDETHLYYKEQRNGHTQG